MAFAPCGIFCVKAALPSQLIHLDIWNVYIPPRPIFCTSQQKVDTFFIFYTLKTEHSTPYIVLVSNSLMSMQVFLH